MKNVYGDLVDVLVQAEGIDSKPGNKLKSWSVFTCSILISIVVVILTSIDPILEKCVHLQVHYSRVLSQYFRSKLAHF